MNKKCHFTVHRILQKCNKNYWNIDFSSRSVTSKTVIIGCFDVIIGCFDVIIGCFDGLLAVLESFCRHFGCFGVILPSNLQYWRQNGSIYVKMAVFYDKYGYFTTNTAILRQIRPYSAILRQIRPYSAIFGQIQPYYGKYSHIRANTAILRQIQPNARPYPIPDPHTHHPYPTPYPPPGYTTHGHQCHHGYTGRSAVSHSSHGSHRVFTRLLSVWTQRGIPNS